MTELLKRARFTKVDLVDIVQNPAGSGKAYGSAAVMFLVSYLASRGFNIPADVASAAAAFGASVGAAVVSFAVAWLFPNREA